MYGQWNYRVVKREVEKALSLGGGVVISYAIHEAYYNDGEEKPFDIALEPCSPQGDTVEELRESMDLMMQAFDREVLNYGDF